MKLVRFYNFILIVVIGLIWLTGWIGTDYIKGLVLHNIAINLSILILFFSASVWVFIDRFLFFTKINSFEILKKNEKCEVEKLKKHIFGKSYYKTIIHDDDYDSEIFESWKGYNEWKPKILEYLSGTFIGLGLMGTFIGLMKTLANVFNIISQDVQGKNLIAQLGEPLSGMSVAFSASMLGLGTSLIVGLMSIIISKINSDYIKEVESWLHVKYKSVSDSGTYFGNARKNLSLFKDVVTLLSEVGGEVKRINNNIVSIYASQDLMNKSLESIAISSKELNKVDHLIYELNLSNKSREEYLFNQEKIYEILINIHDDIKTSDEIINNMVILNKSIDYLKEQLNSIDSNTKELELLKDFIFRGEILENMLIQCNQRIENTYSKIGAVIDNEIKNNADIRKEYLSFKIKTDEINESISSRNNDIEALRINMDELKHKGESTLNEVIATRMVIEKNIKKDIGK